MKFFYRSAKAFAVIFILWIYAIAPGLTSPSEIDSFARYDYAHRGLHDDNIPENSLPAFDLAAEAGYGIELDVQLTSDDEVVVVHDPTMERVSWGYDPISELSYDELTSYYLESSVERVPTLQQALNTIDGRTPLIVEIKTYNDPYKLCPLVAEILQNYKGKYCIMSFSPEVLRWFKEHEPWIITGQLSRDLSSDKSITRFEGFRNQNLLSNYMCRPDFQAYHYKTRRNPSMLLSKALFGTTEASWTVKDTVTYRQMKEENNIVIFEDIRPYVPPILKEEAEKESVPALAPPVSEEEIRTFLTNNDSTKRNPSMWNW